MLMVISLLSIFPAIILFLGLIVLTELLIKKLIEKQKVNLKKQTKKGNNV